MGYKTTKRRFAFLKRQTDERVYNKSYFLNGKLKRKFTMRNCETYAILRKVLLCRPLFAVYAQKQEVCFLASKMNRGARDRI